ncbi:MAG: hypothetical protein WD673_09975 [Alphaproteobacteria bacterium]
MDSRFKIIESSSNALNLQIDISTKYRIGAISDGFPHYVHLICERLFWEVFDDPQIQDSVRPEHFVKAIKSAVQSVEPTLRAAYDKATKKYNEVYEEILWAVTDDHQLQRRSADIYQSYLRIMEDRGKRLPTKDKFNARMNNLKKPAHGNVLVGTRAGWYRFRENILRGFVRLRAEEQGVVLDREHALLPSVLPVES